ncbi:histidine kinase 2-like isoform X2 [Raphanus sativus]|uniref:histidine kinase n=1 Tax=Raphanus sativus TaxID=3726 RepID=A0A6J0P0T8_RAPSA|nr:histidine kinase 2-like isoform X2 [Raphanus sativus]XP_056863136.1 histidine kinase 2-like isoform X2 [Raphanus sativus]
MLKLLMDTDLDAKQMDSAETAHGSRKDLISLINEVLDQAKIESGRIKLENVPFDLRFLMDNVSSLLSGKVAEKRNRVFSRAASIWFHDQAWIVTAEVVTFKL